MFGVVWRLSWGMLLVGVLLLFGGFFTNFALSLLGLVLIMLWVVVWFAGIYLADRLRDDRLRREGVSVEAVVTGWTPQGPITRGARTYSATAGFLTYRFEVAVPGEAPRSIEATDNVWASVHHRYPLGSKIPILYARSDPNVNKVADDIRESPREGNGAEEADLPNTPVADAPETSATAVEADPISWS